TTIGSGCMSSYEIEIPWKTNEWEPVAFRYPMQDGEHWLDDHGAIVKVDANRPPPLGPRLIVRRKVRKYDWSKTLDDVLVHVGGFNGFHTRQLSKSIPGIPEIAPIWQPNIHGKCPVDPDASIVQVEFADGVR